MKIKPQIILKQKVVKPKFFYEICDRCMCKVRNENMTRLYETKTLGVLGKQTETFNYCEECFKIILDTTDIYNTKYDTQYVYGK